MSSRSGVEIFRSGSSEHVRDVATLRARSLPLPCSYIPLHTYGPNRRCYWVRFVSPHGALLSGLSVELIPSRALRGTHVARIERLGRALHAEVPRLGEGIASIARELPRVQRLDIQVFDEDAIRRNRMVEDLESVGARNVDVPRSYRRTPILQLGSTANELYGRLSSRARRALRKFDLAGMARIGPIEDAVYISRMKELYAQTFERTGTQPPPVDFGDILRDARDGRHSLLAGVYWQARPFPRDLVAVFWGRLHGDYASYDIGASERADDLEQVPLGYPLMFHLANWARARGATWLDMGGIPSAEVGPDHALQGIVAFKRAFTQDERDVSVELVMEPWPILSATASVVRRVGRLVGLGR